MFRVLLFVSTKITKYFYPALFFSPDAVIFSVVAAPTPEGAPFPVGVDGIDGVTGTSKQ
ncbi:MAG: hypothetical protein JJE08_08405 [Proteiniphilum sp.]|nr:hypothetical protein [Proteiniphilum sp.]